MRRERESWHRAMPRYHRGGSDIPIRRGSKPIALAVFAPELPNMIGLLPGSLDRLLR
jgi:hypothetical protein